MKLLPPLPPPRLLPSKTSEPRPRSSARTPLELARRAWRPEPGFPAPSRPSPPGSRVGWWRDVPMSRLVIGGLAVAIVGAIVALFILESRWGYSGRVVKVVMVNSWNADRSAADMATDEAKVVAKAHGDAAESRTYIATLTGPAQVKAQAQYDAYISAQSKELQPEGYVAPKVVPQVAPQVAHKPK
jgi:hypothetical protein